MSFDVAGTYWWPTYLRVYYTNYSVRCKSRIDWENIEKSTDHVHTNKYLNIIFCGNLCLTELQLPGPPVLPHLHLHHHGGHQDEALPEAPDVAGADDRHRCAEPGPGQGGGRLLLRHRGLPLPPLPLLHGQLPGVQGEAGSQTDQLREI